MNPDLKSSPTKETALEAQAFYRMSHSELLRILESDSDRGLSEGEARQRLKQYGKNDIEVKREKPLILLLAAQLTSPLIWILIFAAGLAFLFEEFLEGAAIVGVILINTSIGFFMEWQARRSMKALRQMSDVTSVVIRDGLQRRISSQQLTIGDLIRLEAGDVVPADSRLIKQQNLAVDEAALTGESVQRSKSPAALNKVLQPADRKNSLFKGTTVVRGNGQALVTAIGKDTELGQIAKLTAEAQKESTPLEKKLQELSHKLLWMTLVLALLIFILGMWQGRTPFLMIETAIALAIAAIPEGLPIVATIALAKGMIRLARDQVIVKKLSAVETLGETQVIFTDKTGTITENQLLPDMLCFEYGTAGIQLKNQQLVFQRQEDQFLIHTFGFSQMMKVGVLCNDASLALEPEAEGVGDPLELALLKLGKSNGFHPEQLRKGYPRLQEIPFDSESKMMGTLHKNGLQTDYLVCVKGAIEVVIRKCDFVITRDGKAPLSDPQQWLDRAQQLAARGLRILALAYSEINQPETDFFAHLTLLGFVGFLDPPRPEVRKALSTCKEGGIKVIMVTGDHLATAQNIAFRAGLTDQEDAMAINGDVLSLSDPEQEEQILNTRVFARVSPSQKLELVRLFQEKGYTCGMTGDGINDTPALKKADIGIAMGKRGTEAAKEVADLILKDDAFPAIVTAIKQGRGIFENIRLFVIYLLSCNMSELFVVGVAFLANLALPLLPLQILFINMITDVFPALALGMNKESEEVMQHPPRTKQSPIIGAAHWKAIILYAMIITIATLGALLYAVYVLKASPAKANNFAFYTLILAQLWHVFNLRRRDQSFWSNEITRNKYIWGALLICLLITVGIYQIPILRNVLQLVPLSLGEIGLLIGFSCLPVVIIQIFKQFRWVS